MISQVQRFQHTFNSTPEPVNPFIGDGPFHSMKMKFIGHSEPVRGEITKPGVSKRRRTFGRECSNRQ